MIVEGLSLGDDDGRADGDDVGAREGLLDLVGVSLGLDDGSTLFVGLEDG